MSSKHYLQQVQADLKHLGISVTSVGYTSGGHIRLLVTDENTGRDAFVICSATPSDRRAIKNIIRDARSVLRPQNPVQARKANFAAVAL